MGDREKVRLWGHSAIHLVTGPAKAIVAAYYGTPARYAYFAGCSTGGAQGMEEAEFYPDDYYGILAGAPGMSYAHLMLSFLWGLKVSETPGATLSLDKLKLLHAAVMSAWDTDDGLRDGLLSNPLNCHFDVGTLTCEGAEAAACLSPAQVTAARLIYQGPRNPRTGKAIYPGFAFGPGSDPSFQSTNPFVYGWTSLQGPLARRFAIPLLRDMVYHDPIWNWTRFDWDGDVGDLDRRIGGDITAINPDLRPLQKRGGKLLMYQGWGDPLNAPTLPIDFRRQVINVFSRGSRRSAATLKVDAFFRVFMVPGMAHCQGDPGLSKFDALSH